MRMSLVILFLLTGLGGAWAHASLTASVPTDGTVVAVAPERFALSFSEPVSPLYLSLLRPDGNALSLDDFALRDRTLEIVAPTRLGKGTHVLSWRVVSEDGHPVGGSVIFSIGAPSGAELIDSAGVDWDVRIGLWASKIALYAGLFFGVGGVFAQRVLMPSLFGSGKVVRIALATGLAGAILSVGFQGLDALGSNTSQLMERAVWETGFATSYGRTVTATVLSIILAALAIPASAMVGRMVATLGLICAALALALSGHASAASPQWLMRPMMFIHALAIAVWIGALFPLALAILNRQPGRVDALRRFSTVIPGFVAALVTAGVVLTAVQVQRPAALFETAYGAVLLVKLFLLACLFLLAAVNRWILTKPAEAGEQVAERRLVRSIAAETLFVFLIFGTVAAWRFTPPPRALAVVAAGPAKIHVHSSKAMADLTVEPGQTGLVSLSAVVMTGDFGPLDAKELTFVLSNPEAGIEPFRRKARRPGDGTWRAEGVALPVPGIWRVRLDILISDFDIARLEGEIKILP